MICSLVNRLYKSFLNLNLFKKDSSSEQSLAKEVLATRIYLIILLVSLLGITITAALIVRTVDKIEYKVSYKKFSQLIDKYSTTLHCPCSKPAVNYAKFVKIQVKFHQVCSSEFIQQIWLEKLLPKKNISLESINDFRNFLSFFWKTMGNLCTLSSKSWDNVLANFKANRLITPKAVAEKVIRIQIEDALRNQIALSKTTLTRNLHALQIITRGNQIASALQTNYYLRYPPEHLGPWHDLKMAARSFGNCTCLSIQQCPRSAIFIDDSNHSVSIPGMIIDCLIVDGTLASTLECYYNQSCISLLHKQLSTKIEPLSNHLNKYFSMYSTIQMIINELMVDEIITEIQFDKYFFECGSNFCSYSYTRRFDILFIFTTVTGIMGILSFIMRFIARFIAKMILRRKHRVVPEERISTVILPQLNRSKLN